MTAWWFGTLKMAIEIVNFPIENDDMYLVGGLEDYHFPYIGNN